MAVKERLIKRLEQMDEGRLEHLEKRLKQEDKKPRELEQRVNHERRGVDKAQKTEQRLAALRAVVGIINDPDDIAAFEEATRRQPLFGGRTLDMDSNDTA